MTQTLERPRRHPRAPALHAFALLASLCLPAAVEAADAAPQAETDPGIRATVAHRNAGGPRRALRQIRYARDRRVAKHAILVALVADAPLYGAPGTYGLTAEYQYRLSPTWRLAAGGELRIGASPTVLQPHVGAEATVSRFSQVSIVAGAGLAVPFWFGKTYTGAAVAMRGIVGVRWHWPLGTRMIPFAATTVMLGPVLTPAQIQRDIHASLQLLVGMRVAIL